MAMGTRPLPAPSPAAPHLTLTLAIAPAWGCFYPCRGAEQGMHKPLDAGREPAGACSGRGPPAPALFWPRCPAGHGWGAAAAPGPDRQQDGWQGLCTQLRRPTHGHQLTGTGWGEPRAFSGGHGHVWGAGGLCCCGGGRDTRDTLGHELGSSTAPGRGGGGALHACAHVNACVCLFRHVHGCSASHMCIYACIGMCARACISMHVCAWIHVSMGGTCTCMPLYTCACAG